MTEPEVLACPWCGASNLAGADTCFRCARGLYAVTEGAVLGGRYTVLMPLGRGGMGMVYKAHDRELDEVVALKVLRPEVASSPDVAKRFRSEIKLARRVRHRNVCGIHEYGQEGHLRFIVMEYIEGVDLKQVLRRHGAMAPDQAFAVAVEVAEGLQAIHEAGIVHRDLKTPNIMLDGRGVIRLMDFGIAKQFGMDGTTGATATGQAIGTPEYMSPEQARAERVDARSDIYALGVVLYELFTGSLPFHGDTPMATLLKHLQEPPPLETPAATRLPSAAKSIVSRALAKQPADRYATAREMADDLRRARAESGAPAGLALPAFVREATAREPAPRTESLPTPVPTAVPTPVPTPTPAAADPTWRPFAPAAEAERQAGAAGAIRASAPIDRDRADESRTRFPRAGLWLALSIVPIGLVIGTLVMLRQADVPRTLDATGTGHLPQATPPPSAEGPKPVESPAPPVTSPAAVRPDGAARVAAVRSPSPKPPRSPGAVPSPAAITRGTATPDLAPPNTGLLQVTVRPFAEVSVDGRVVGTSPVAPLRLPAGRYTVRLAHPDYLPLPKRVTVRAGETAVLDVDMAQEAFRK